MKNDKQNEAIAPDLSINKINLSHGVLYYANSKSHRH